MGAIVTTDAAGCRKKVARAVVGKGGDCLIALKGNQKTGATTRDERYFISSLDVDPERALQAARSHWDVENPLHWVLDMIFDEDHSRARSGFSAENLAIMRHMAYNATRKSEATKGGMKRRKKSLTWNPDKLLATLRAA
jgi:predicted transposase YbfD/YdcC